MDAPTETTQRRYVRGGYSYRSKPQRTPETHVPAVVGRLELIQELMTHRQLMSHALSTIRALTAARNELIAQALEDGLTVATISKLTGENMHAIRTIGLAYDDLHPSGISRGVHLDTLKAKNDELMAAARQREQIIERREALIIRALRSRSCDDLEIASLTGLTPEHIRKTGRGTGRTVFIRTS